VPPQNAIVDPGKYWENWVYDGNQKVSNATIGRSLLFVDTPKYATINPLASVERHIETYLVGVNSTYEGLSAPLYGFGWQTDYKEVTTLGYLAGAIKNVRTNLPIEPWYSNGLFYAKDLIVDNALNVRVKNSGLAAFRSIESVSESAALRSGNQFSDLDFTGLTELDTNALIRSVQDLIADFPLTSS
jgi:hypothetical protein